MAFPRQGGLKRYIRYNALRRGLFGGSRFWTGVFVAGFVARWLGRVSKRGEMPVITSDELHPGEGFVIRHLSVGQE